MKHFVGIAAIAVLSNCTPDFNFSRCSGPVAARCLAVDDGRIPVGKPSAVATTPTPTPLPSV